MIENIILLQLCSLIKTKKINNQNPFQMKNTLVLFILLVLFRISILAQGFDNEINKNQVDNLTLNSKSIEKVKLDSVIIESFSTTASDWYLGNKYEMQYNENGKEISFVIYGWNTLSAKWRPGSKFESVYNENDSLQTYISYNWNNNNSSWVPYQKKEYNYDSLGNKTLEAEYYWDNLDTKSWNGKSKYEYAFDSNKNKILQLKFCWTNNSKWVICEKFEYKYNFDGNKTMEAKFGFNPLNFELVGISKNDYAFNSSGNLTEHLVYAWSESGKDWIQTSKTENKYENEFLKRIDTYVWNAELIKWVNYSQTNITLNDQDSLLISIFSRSNEDTGDLIEESKTESKYDLLGNETLLIKYTWDSSIKEWLKVNKTEKEFDDAGRLRMESEYYWSQEKGIWIGRLNKCESEYDSKGNITAVKCYSWDLVNDVWFLYLKDRMEYNSFNRVTLDESFRRNISTGEWEEGNKSIYRFNSNNRLLFYEHFTWDNPTQSWKEKEKYENELDFNENLISETNFVWDKNTNNYIENYKSEFTVNDNFNTEDIIFSKRNYGSTGIYGNIAQSSFPNMLVQAVQSYLNKTSKELQPSLRYTFYYTIPSIDANSEIKNNSIQIYPNPANEYIHISDITTTSEFEIYSMNGSKVFSMKLEKNQTISIKHLISGVYSYEIKSKDELRTGKLIIR